MAKLIELRDVYKIYGEGLESEVRALDGVSLDIEKGEFVAVVGQSGSGKSTMMNVLGCLDIPTRGTYRLDGVDVRELSDKELSRIRNKQIGFIFQQYNLIQNLTVLENVELPLIYQGIDPIDRRELAIQALNRVGLADRAQHKPTQMSGGQQQRVAIARAIVSEPRLLLLDEPLSNLDAKLRNQMRAEIIKLRQRINTTFIYVTHDQTEAMTLGDRIVIMKDGFIQQIGTPQEVFDHPANLFVAGFIGTPQMNLFDAKLVKNSDGKYAVAIDGINVELAEDKQARLSAKNVPEQDVTLGVRPDHIMLCADGVKGTVDVSEMMGSAVHLHVSACGSDTIMIVPTTELESTSAFTIGSPIAFTFNGVMAHLFDRNTQKNLEV